MTNFLCVNIPSLLDLKIAPLKNSKFARNRRRLAANAVWVISLAFGSWYFLSVCLSPKPLDLGFASISLSICSHRCQETAGFSDIKKQLLSARNPWGAGHTGSTFIWEHVFSGLCRCSKDSRVPDKKKHLLVVYWVQEILGEHWAHWFHYHLKRPTLSLVYTPTLKLCQIYLFCYNPASQQIPRQRGLSCQFFQIPNIFLLDSNGYLEALIWCSCDLCFPLFCCFFKNLWMQCWRNQIRHK